MIHIFMTKTLTFTIIWNTDIICRALRHVWIDGLLSAFLFSFATSYGFSTIFTVALTRLNAIGLCILVPFSFCIN